MDIKIVLRKDKKNKNGYCPLCIQLVSGSESKRIALGVKVREKDYDISKQIVRKSDINYENYNNTLDIIKSNISYTNHHFNEVLLVLKSNITDHGEILMYKKIYDSISNLVEKKGSKNIDSIMYSNEIELLKEQLVYEFSINPNKRPVISLSPKLTPENLFKLKKIAEAIQNNQPSEESEEWFTKIEPKKKFSESREVKSFKSKVSEYEIFSKQEKKKTTSSRIEGHFRTLKEFAKSKGIELTFNSFDEDFGRNFKYYLENEHINNNSENKRKGVSSGTVHNIQKNISAFLNWAFKKDYHNNIKFKQWDTKKPKSDLQYLDESQLVILRNKDLSTHPNLEVTRDLWLFMAYTGMRISDIELWQPSHVNKGFIKFLSQKANKICTIPLNQVSLTILNKYGNKLPRQSQANMNLNIKKVLRECGMDYKINRSLKYGKNIETMTLDFCDSITIHSARRSFINLMISKNIDSFKLSSMTGNTVQNLGVYYKANVDNLISTMNNTNFL